MKTAQDVMDVFHARVFDAPCESVRAQLQLAWMLADAGDLEGLVTYLQTRPEAHLGMLAGYTNRPRLH